MRQVRPPRHAAFAILYASCKVSALRPRLTARSTGLLTCVATLRFGPPARPVNADVRSHVDGLCLTDATIDALRAAVGRVIAGIMVPNHNRELQDSFSSLGIALDNGTYLHLFATSI